LIDSGAIVPKLSQYLISENLTIKKDSAWALSNILAGDEEHVEAVYFCDVLPRLVAIIKVDCD